MRVGDVNYWCDNKNVTEVPEELEEEEMENYPDMCKRFSLLITLSPKTLESLQASTKAIEALGIRIGEIGADAQKKIVESINEAAAKIKPVEFDFGDFTESQEIAVQKAKKTIVEYFEKK